MRVRVRVRVKSDEAFGLLRERVSSQNSQQNFQFALSLQSPHEKFVASLNQSSPRHRRTMKNAKSEEKGALDKKKKSVLCHMRLMKERTCPPEKGQIIKKAFCCSLSDFHSFARFLDLSLKAGAKKKRKCEPVVERRRRCCQRRQRRYRRGAIPSPQIIVEKEERRAR